MKIFKALDGWLIFPAVLLVVFSVAVILSTSFELAKEQAVFAVVGFVLMILVARTRAEYFWSFAPHFFVLTIILLFATLILGGATKGAIRWLPLFVGNLTLQSSELAKFFLIIFWARFFSSSFWRNDLKSFFFSLILVALPAGLIYLQPNLGTTLITVFLWLFLVVAAGYPGKYLLLIIGLGLVLLPLGWAALRPYQLGRVISFLNPEADPRGAGYHVLQAKIAIGSGGIFGRGFGQGTQSRLRFLPEHQTDFIFASLAEEWGFMGALILISLYAVVLVRLLTLTQKVESGFAPLICCGVFAIIFGQFIINVGMNLGLTPVTGIPLPMVSAGGSSLVTTLMALGLVQSAVATGRQLS